MKTSLDRFFRGIEYLMAIFLAIMIIFMFVNIVMRFVASSGFVASEEIARLAFIFLVYLGTIGAYRDNQHLGVNMIFSRLGPTAGRIVYVITQLIVIWVMFLLAWGSIRLAGQTFNDSWVATGFPRWIVSGVGAVTGISIIIFALSNIFDALVKKIPLEDLMAGEEVDDIDPEDLMSDEELEQTVAELSGGKLRVDRTDEDDDYGKKSAGEEE